MSGTHEYERFHNSNQDEEQVIITREVPHLVECCFCFSLQTGVIILGWLTIIGSAMDAATSVSLIEKAVTAVNEDSNYMAGLWTAVAVSLTSLLISVSLGSLLLVGVYKRKPRCLTPYVIYCVVYSVLIALLLMLEIALGFAVALNFLVAATSISFKVYFAIVVNSYKQELINEQRTPNDRNEPTAPALVH